MSATPLDPSDPDGTDQSPYATSYLPLRQWPARPMMGMPMVWTDPAGNPLASWPPPAGVPMVMGRANPPMFDTHEDRWSDEPARPRTRQRARVIRRRIVAWWRRNWTLVALGAATLALWVWFLWIGTSLPR